MNKRKQIIISSSTAVLATMFIAVTFIGFSPRVALAGTSSSDDYEQQQKCKHSAKTISKDADGHASSNVYEINLARTSPTVSILGEKANDLTDDEFKYQKASASGNDNVLFIAEIQLTQDEVQDVEKSLEDKGWEVTAIHSHELHEDPLMLFLHAQNSGHLDNLLQDLHGALKDDTKCECT
jgi:hypothetical protein